MNDPSTNSPILVCDVDGVVVDLSQKWYEWLRTISTKYVEHPSFEEVVKHYDFYVPFKELTTEQAARHFWKMEHIYDHVSPLEGSVEALEAFKEAGWDIVFASHCEGAHSKSKWEFLNRHFPVDGFMATREKHFLRANIVIDDRVENLLKFPSDVFCILMDAPHNKDVDTEGLGLYRLHSLNGDTAKFIMKYWWRYYAK